MPDPIRHPVRITLKVSGFRVTAGMTKQKDISGSEDRQPSADRLQDAPDHFKSELLGINSQLILNSKVKLVYRRKRERHANRAKNAILALIQLQQTAPEGQETPP